MKITVEYEINEDGSCIRCGGLIKYGKEVSCAPFREHLEYKNIHIEQCQDCKNYILSQQAVLKCRECVNLGDYPDFDCIAGQDYKEFKL